MEDFGLIHQKGRLHVVVNINGELYTQDVTEYFDNHNAHDEWLDYRLGLKEMAEASKLTKEND